MSNHMVRMMSLVADINYGFNDLQSSAVRRDRWVILVVIAIAVVIAAGLLVAWWAACQARGMYPALDMPNWQDGGTWKVYCTS